MMAKADDLIAQNASAYTSSRNLFIGVAAGAIVLALLLGFVLVVVGHRTRSSGSTRGSPRLPPAISPGTSTSQPRRARRAGRQREPHERRAPASLQGARDRQPAQVRLPRQHVARAPHAAERDHRLLPGAARGDVRRDQREAEGVSRGHPHVRKPPALAHQRHPRPVEGRGGTGRAPDRAVLAARRARARRRDGARTCPRARRPGGLRLLATAPTS